MGALDLASELVMAQFGDSRLNERAVEIVGRLEQRPNVSIPAAMTTRKELEACYRFFDNVKLTFRTSPFEYLGILQRRHSYDSRSVI